MDTEDKREDSKVRTESHEMYRMTQSDGWRHARALLENKLIDIQSVRNIDVTKVEDLVIDIKARNAVIDIIKGWLQEIEGKTERHKDALDEKIEESTFVRNYE